ncbi:hypothetical protein Dsin_013520 [Dipteronia sinensis]|uniref:Uncharacterized protein n=1 Tax=Dipteronia sinensis TaxID=43782 RepID=A0AAE0EAN4_9ROSI|nr:hypothetical protein Dsin_013520 [Dipteronia sinensis]
MNICFNTYVLWATRSGRLRVDWLILVSAFAQDQECSNFVVMQGQATKVVPQCVHCIHPLLQPAGCKELIDTHKLRGDNSIGSNPAVYSNVICSINYCHLFDGLCRQSRGNIMILSRKVL